MIAIVLPFLDPIAHSLARSNTMLSKARQQHHKLTVRPRSNMKLRAAVRAKAQRGAFDKLSFPERKAALNLAQLSHSNGDLQLSADQVENLIETLIVRMPQCQAMGCVNHAKADLILNLG